MLLAVTFTLSQLFTSPLEFFAFTTSVACVWLITIKKPHAIKVFRTKLFSYDFNWNWPVGIITSVLYFFIFWKYRLWMNAILQVFYIVTGFWGWYKWMKGFSFHDERPILNLNKLQWFLSIVVIAAVTLAAWPAMIHFADAAPFWDSIIFGLSVVAQAVMTWKYRQHWWIWIFEDLIATVLFWNLGLGLTSILYFIFGLLCIRGMVTWKAMSSSWQKGRMSLVEG